MVFWKVFLNSMQIPRKKSVFTLNRVRMDIAVVYMFILIAFASIPSLIEQIIDNSTSSFYVHIFFLLIFFFMFHYLVIVIGSFALISVYAYIGTIIAKFTKRRLHFALLWKIVAFSTTLPLVIYTVFALFVPVPNLFFWLGLIYIGLILMKIISIYPSIK